MEARLVEGLFKIIQLRDPETAIHSQLVASVSVQLARRFDPRNYPNYYNAGLLHDIGKIGMSDLILKGNSMLTDSERRILVNHTIEGHDVLSSFGFDDVVLSCVRDHHERYDGSGYGRGLNGRNIPLCARILAVADTYATLIQGRPYKEKVTVEQALAIMIKDAHLFDPDILQGLIKVVPVNNVC